MSAVDNITDIRSECTRKPLASTKYLTQQNIANVTSTITTATMENAEAAISKKQKSCSPHQPVRYIKYENVEPKISKLCQFTGNYGQQFTNVGSMTAPVAGQSTAIASNVATDGSLFRQSVILSKDVSVVKPTECQSPHKLPNVSSQQTTVVVNPVTISQINVTATAGISSGSRLKSISPGSALSSKLSSVPHRGSSHNFSVNEKSGKIISFVKPQVKISGNPSPVRTVERRLGEKVNVKTSSSDATERKQDFIKEGGIISPKIKRESRIEQAGIELCHTGNTAQPLLTELRKQTGEEEDHKSDIQYTADEDEQMLWEEELDYEDDETEREFTRGNWETWTPQKETAGTLPNFTEATENDAVFIKGHDVELKNSATMPKRQQKGEFEGSLLHFIHLTKRTQEKVVIVVQLYVNLC